MDNAESFATVLPDPEASPFDALAMEPVPEPSPIPPGWPQLASDPEPSWKRRVYELLAIGVVLGFFFLLLSFWAPAPGRPGIDENGYMVGGKMLADHFSTSYKAPEPYSYVGMMWIRTPQGLYYPKYPAGVPLIYATLLRLSPAHGKIACFYVSPVCSALAVAAMFLLTRLLAGSFYGLLGAIALATGQTTLLLANIPSSHAPALCFTLWGMCLLAFWCQNGRAWIGALSGLLLGYAITIRYTEGLLILPLLAAVVTNLCFALRGSAGHTLRVLLLAPLPLVTWAIPPLALVIFNRVTMGLWTGYGFTKESTGFTYDEFLHKWEFTAQQVYLFGLFFIAPLGIVGMVMLFRSSWRWGLMMTLWFVPGAILYTAYYWGLRMPGVGFLRFFLTLFPPVIACAMWMLRSAGRADVDQWARRLKRWQWGLLLSLSILPITIVSAAYYLSHQIPIPGVGFYFFVAVLLPVIAFERWRVQFVDRGGADELVRFRGSVVNPLAAGIAVAIAASAGLYASLYEMERQHAGNLNLSYSAHQFLSKVPNHPGGKPVVFSDSGIFPQLLMHLQFMGDDDWYASDAFENRFDSGFFMLGHRKKASDQDSPVLVQPERVDYMASVFKGKNTKDLIREQNRIMDDALDHGRPVYALMTAAMAWDFEYHFLGKTYQAKEIDRWRELADVPLQREDTPLTSQSHLPNMIIDWQPQSWKLLKITRKAPATQTATR